MISWTEGRACGTARNGLSVPALLEDACRARKGSLPRVVLAAFANVALTILRLLKATTVKRAMKRLYRNGAQAVAQIMR